MLRVETYNFVRTGLYLMAFLVLTISRVTLTPTEDLTISSIVISNFPEFSKWKNSL